MANEPPDDSHGDTPPLLPNPADSLHATTHYNANAPNENVQRSLTVKPSHYKQSRCKTHVRFYDSIRPTTTMANESPNDSHDDTPPLLPNPADFLHATTHYNATAPNETRRALTVKPSHYKQSHCKTHVRFYDSIWSTTTMAYEPPDDSHGDTPLLLPNPADFLPVTTHGNATTPNVKAQRSSTVNPSHYQQSHHKQHVRFHDNLWSTKPMENLPPDDSQCDTPLLLSNPAESLYTTTHDTATPPSKNVRRSSTVNPSHYQQSHSKQHVRFKPHQELLAMFRDEMEADRLETQQQLKLLQIQTTFLQTIMTGLMTHLAQSSVTTWPSADISPILRPITTTPETSMFESTTSLQEPDDQHPITSDDPPSYPTIKTTDTLLIDACICLNSMILPDLVFRPDPMTINEQVNELRPLSRMIALQQGQNSI
jgi:hypothetical protein